MVIAFSGTRNLYARNLLAPLVAALPRDAIVLHGASGAVDWEVDGLARKRGLVVRKFAANWERHGRAAGPIRNLEMIGEAWRVVLVWDGTSPGTGGCYALAKRRKLPYECYVGSRIGVVYRPPQRHFYRAAKRQAERLIYCDWRLHDKRD